MYALTHATLYTADQVLPDHAVLVEGDRLHAILPSQELPSDLPQIDLAGAQVAPGFIDLQLNGCGGVMFNDTITAATLETMHQTNLRSGTTSFLPTLITTSDEDMRAAIALVQAYRQQQPSSVLGLHLEGPYLNPRRKGIHNERFVRAPDWDMIKTILAAGPEVVRLVTLAPEQVEPEMIERLDEAGIVVSAGHSDATFEQAIASIHQGVRMATHLFNAMSPWQGRSPGLVGAVLQQPQVYAGIIADGQHVHFASIELVHRLKQDRLILVSDATPPVGTRLTSFEIGGQQVFYREGRCVSADGTLGGSALTLMEAIANCVRFAHIPLPEAVRMASTYPAALLGMAGELGRIAPGYCANLAIFSDTWEVTAVVDRGQFIPQPAAPV